MKKFFIFFVVLCAGLHLSAMGETAIEKAIGSANTDQVNTLLKNNPNVADSKRDDKEAPLPMLQYNNHLLGQNCTGKDYLSKKTEINARLQIAKLLIENMSDFNVELTKYWPGNELGYKHTLLDQAEKYKENGVQCSIFDEIIALLKSKGAKTYAELHPETPSSSNKSGTQQNQQSVAVQQNTQPVTNAGVKKETEKKEAKSAPAPEADKNTATGETITVSGTVVETNNSTQKVSYVKLKVFDKNDQPIMKGREILSGGTDMDGNFKIENVPNDAVIKVSATGYIEKTVSVQDIIKDNGNSIIKLENVSRALEQVDIKGDGSQEGTPCPADSVLDSENCSTDGIGSKVCQPLPHVKSGKIVNRKCVVDECNSGYVPKDGKCVMDIPKKIFVDPEITIQELPQALDPYKKLCKDNGGTWNDVNGCSCSNNIRNTHFDIEKKQCVCDDENKVIENNKCVCVLKKGENNVKEIDSKKCEITKCDDGYSISDDKKSCVKNEIDNEKLKQAEDDYKAARDKEQSKENKMLTAATVAATGIGGMELARGLAEQSVDRDAAEDMEAYIATMRCEYGDGKSVKTIDVKDTSIELPGGNDQNFMNYRAQYLTLAADLKARKTALGMKPGIESEEILDKATVGLYDDENTGITSGHEASLYRAQMLKSESDQTNLDETSAASQRRVTGGAIATGVGVVGGALGNQIINGELGEKLKENKDRNSLISEIKNGLKSRGFTNIDKLDFSKIDISTLIKLQDIDWNNLSVDSQKDITKVLNTTNTTSFRSSFSKLGLGDAFK